MKKTSVVLLICLMLLSLYGCSTVSYVVNTDDCGEYEAKKEECIQSIIDNIDAIDIIVQHLKTYDFDISFCCVDGVIEVYGKMTDAELQSVLQNGELMDNLRIVFQNEYIEHVTKVKFKNREDYFYAIGFISIRQGYVCDAYIAQNEEDIISADEHITGNWYFSSNQYE